MMNLMICISEFEHHLSKPSLWTHFDKYPKLKKLVTLECKVKYRDILLSHRDSTEKQLVVTKRFAV